MKRLSFKGVRISGVATILAEHDIPFENEIANYDFPPEKSLRLKNIMGYRKHRLVGRETASSDLVTYGLRELIQQNLIQPDEIDGLMVVTQSPDYFLPPTSNVIQGRLGLKKEMLCLDINQGCAGFLIGLLQSFMMLQNPAFNKVVLANVDVLSKKTSPKDRNSFPIIGDAASVTLIEKTPEGPAVFANLCMNGALHDKLIIPAGAFRTPSSEETRQLVKVDEGNLRSRENLTMDGTAVFNFVQSEVPPMIADLLAFASLTREEVDFYLFHQPNKFMLQKLASAIGVPVEKMPNNIVENFGNASGVTIPTSICFNLGEKLIENRYHVCLAGFGSGLTWASMLLELGKLDFCRLMEYQKPFNGKEKA